jgi:glucosamine-6-phosphate deaminase
MKTSESGLQGKIIVADDYDALSQTVAKAIAEQLRLKPKSSLGLPVGKSISGCYEILAQWSKQEQISWQNAQCFALDDYLQVDEEHSFQHFLRSKLYQFTNLEAEACFNPRYHNDYDQAISAAGGLDCCILGLGRNGHIAFNEPDTPKASWTHCVWLSESTVEANKSYFAGVTAAPSKAITMGISTILASRAILLVATGQGKQEILKRALTGPPTPGIPASFLTLHPNLTIITDFQS